MIQSDFPRYALYTGNYTIYSSKLIIPCNQGQPKCDCTLPTYQFLSVHEKKCHFLIINTNTYHNLVGDDNKWHSKNVQESENYVCVCVVCVLAHALSISD